MGQEFKQGTVAMTCLCSRGEPNLEVPMSKDDLRSVFENTLGCFQLHILQLMLISSGSSARAVNQALACDHLACTSS